LVDAPQSTPVSGLSIRAEYSEKQYHLEVIDLAKNPALARNHQIVAIPTRVRTLTVAIRKITGDLSDTERVVVGPNIAGLKERGVP
jgi:circadian clock protein KaiB